MENSIVSAHFRVKIGVIILAYVLIMNTIDFFMKENQLNPTITAALIGFSSALITAGIFKKK